ncbi:hypothetical protein PM082_013901 [Marasmius tenuissimus]|nr:hypothetical protein PM082_013901 [Marasmius tenuissimus]
MSRNSAPEVPKPPPTPVNAHTFSWIGESTNYPNSVPAAPKAKCGPALSVLPLLQQTYPGRSVKEDRRMYNTMMNRNQSPPEKQPSSLSTQIHYFFLPPPHQDEPASLDSLSRAQRTPDRVKPTLHQGDSASRLSGMQGAPDPATHPPQRDHSGSL